MDRPIPLTQTVEQVESGRRRTTQRVSGGKAKNGRKFTLSLVVFWTSTFLLTLDYITPEIWSMVVLGTVGAYIAGNVAQKATRREL